MKYDILHELPGRMRVHCRTLRLNPECRIELERWVSWHAELVSASLSPRTGNLLVEYTKNTSREAILVIIDDLRIFGVATLGNGGERRHATVAGAVADATLAVCARALLGILLPRSAQKVMSGWRLGLSFHSLADTFVNKCLSSFFYAAGKFLLFCMAPSSISLRIVMTACVLLIEDSFPSLSPTKQVKYGAHEDKMLADASCTGTTPLLAHSYAI